MQSSFLLPSFLLFKVRLFGREVREPFNFCFIETIDDFVGPLFYKDFFHLLLSVESDLTGRHGCLLVQIAPWCVYYCDVVFLVAYTLV